MQPGARLMVPPATFAAVTAATKAGPPPEQGTNALAGAAEATEVGVTVKARTTALVPNAICMSLMGFTITTAFRSKRSPPPTITASNRACTGLSARALLISFLLYFVVQRTIQAGRSAIAVRQSSRETSPDMCRSATNRERRLSGNVWGQVLVPDNEQTPHTWQAFELVLATIHEMEI